MRCRASPSCSRCPASGVGAYLAVRFLTGYVENRSLRPFGVYCIAAGAACLAWFALA